MMKASAMFARATYVSMLFWAGLVVGRTVPPLSWVWAITFGLGVGVISISFAYLIHKLDEVQA